MAIQNPSKASEAFVKDTVSRFIEPTLDPELVTQQAKIDQLIQQAYSRLAGDLAAYIVPGRELSVALTELETSLLWAQNAIYKPVGPF